MHQHFKDFEFKWNENRIYCAKVLQNGEYQWIRWSDNEGYDLNDVRRGDVIMLQKMHHSKIGHLIKSLQSYIKDENKIITQWAQDDVIYTTYLKALKAPLPRVKELKN